VAVVREEKEHERKLRRLEALRDFVQSGAGATDLVTLLDHAVESAASLVGADRSAST